MITDTAALVQGVARIGHEGRVSVPLIDTPDRPAGEEYQESPAEGFGCGSVAGELVTREVVVGSERGEEAVPDLELRRFAIYLVVVRDEMDPRPRSTRHPDAAISHDVDSCVVQAGLAVHRACFPNPTPVGRGSGNGSICKQHGVLRVIHDMKQSTGIRAAFGRSPRPNRHTRER